MNMIDKITHENVCLRAFSEIIKNGADQRDSGIARLIWTPEGTLSMSFDCFGKEFFQTPVKSFGFYGNKFFIESNHSRYEVSYHEPDGLWHGPVPGEITLGYFKGKLLDSTLAELREYWGTKTSLEIITKSGSNADLYAVMTLNGMSYPLRKICFDAVPVGFGTQGEYSYVLTIYTPRNCYRMVVERGA